MNQDASLVVWLSAMLFMVSWGKLVDATAVWVKSSRELQKLRRLMSRYEVKP